MKKISCAIVDDEPLAVKLIENYVGRTPFLELIGSYTDSVTASVELRDRCPDLLFLDIQMPDIDGMSLARMLSPSTKVVFTTAFREYALDSYDVSALDFLLKPIRYDKFLRAACKAKEWFDMQEDKEPVATRDTNVAARDKNESFLKKDGCYFRIEIDRIVLVEGLKDYVRFFIEDEKSPVTVHLTMKSVESFLPGDRFMRVSRSHIVSLNHIRSVDLNS